MEKSFEGQVALVTGGSTGIGAAVALQLAQAGAKVVITGRHEATLRASAARHPGIDYVVADVARAERCRAQPGRGAQTRFGRLDVLINNAGVLEIVPLADASPEHVRRTWETNVLGLIETTRAALPLLRKSKGVDRQPGDDDRRPAVRQHVGVLREQGGRSGPDAFVGAGAGPRRHPRQRRQPRPDRDADVLGREAGHRRRRARAARRASVLGRCRSSGSASPRRSPR